MTGKTETKPLWLSRWRIGTFGPAAEKPYRRLTRDYLRLILSIVVVFYLCQNIDSISDFSENLFKTVNGLPNDLESFFVLFFSLGTLWALAIIAGAAILARRWRLARDLALAGVFAWVIGRLIGVMIDEGSSITKSLDAVIT